MCGRGLPQRKRHWCRGWVGQVWGVMGERGKLLLVVEGGRGTGNKKLALGARFQEDSRIPWEGSGEISFPETHSCFS